MQARRRLRIANKRKTRLTFFEDGATRRKGDDELTSETTQKADGENRTRLALDYCSHKSGCFWIGNEKRRGKSAGLGMDRDEHLFSRCGEWHRGRFAAFPSRFSAVKLFYDLRLDLRFVWYNGCELGDGH